MFLQLPEPWGPSPVRLKVMTSPSQGISISAPAVGVDPVMGVGAWPSALIRGLERGVDNTGFLFIASCGSHGLPELPRIRPRPFRTLCTQ